MDEQYKPSKEEEPLLKQMEEWANKLSEANSTPAIDFSGDPKELNEFAEKWLNPILYWNWDLGREFGNCAETYPLAMCQSLNGL